MNPKDAQSPATVLEFAMTGFIGAVGAGMSEEDVVGVWGEPSQTRLTRPPSLSYGPIMLYLRSGVVTHIGVYLRNLESGNHNTANGVQLILDLDSSTSVAEFRRQVNQRGGHCEVASELMYADEPEIVLRVLESAVVAVFDETGRLSSLSSEPAERMGESNE
jgi:hypothetical protein